MKKPLFTILLIALVLGVLSTFMLGNSRQSMDMMTIGRGSAGVNMAMPAMDSAVSEKMMIAPDYPMPISGMGDAMNVATRVYEYNSYHSVIVNDVSAYMKNMRDYVTSVKGQVLNSSQGKSDRYNYASLYAKVPVSSFDQTTNKITENVEKIQSESINTADRTGEVVGQAERITKLKADLAVKQAQLEETTVTSERTRIQNEIANLERQITSVEQQAANTQEQVEYATIQINVADNERYFDPQAQGSILEELKEAIHSLKGSLYFLVVILIWVLVYSVILIPLYFVAKWLKDKFSQTKTN